MRSPRSSEAPQMRRRTVDATDWSIGTTGWQGAALGFAEGPRGAGEGGTMRGRWGIAAALLVLVACARTAPEEALRRNIDEMRTAVEARDISGLNEGIALDFIGP